MNQGFESNELTDYLAEQGYDKVEIARILERLTDYDRITFHDSILESFANGTFSLDNVIKEALPQSHPERKQS